jgi:RHS repeat-associated protein
MNVSNQTAFASYQLDEGYGGTFDYAMNRYYAPQWGRFTTPDPYQASNSMVLPQNWNKYAYVAGDPVNKTDPLGLCSPQDRPPCYSVSGYGRHPWQFGGGGGEGGGRDISPGLEWDYSLCLTLYLGEYVQTQRCMVQGIEFIDPSNADPHQQTITGLFDQIRGTMDENCANWLLNNSGFAKPLASINLIDHAVINDLQNFGSVINAVTGSGVGDFSIVVNRNGAVFNNSAPTSPGIEFNAQISSINPGSQRQGVFTLIHEFAHSFNDIGGASGFRPDRGKAKQRPIEQRRCLEELQSHDLSIPVENSPLYRSKLPQPSPGGARFRFGLTEGGRRPTGVSPKPGPPAHPRPPVRPPTPTLPEITPVPASPPLSVLPSPPLPLLTPVGLLPAPPVPLAAGPSAGNSLRGC